MNKIAFNGATLSPWSDFNSIMNNARTLAVHIGDKVFDGDFELREEEGNVVIAFDEPKKRGRPAKDED